jgi:DNA-binding protein
MLADKPRTGLLIKPMSSLQPTRSLSRLLAPLALRNLKRNSVHHSQKQLDVVTSTNFVVRRHKPVANPFNECSMIVAAQQSKVPVGRKKGKSISPLKVVNSYNWVGKRRMAKSRIGEMKIEKLEKSRENEITGWE